VALEAWIVLEAPAEMAKAFPERSVTAAMADARMSFLILSSIFGQKDQLPKASVTLYSRIDTNSLLSKVLGGAPHLKVISRNLPDSHGEGGPQAGPCESNKGQSALPLFLRRSLAAATCFGIDEN
jgi:hypothetical protein